MPSGLRGRFWRYWAKEFFSGVMRVYPSGSAKRVLTVFAVVSLVVCLCVGGFLSQDWRGSAMMIISAISILCFVFICNNSFGGGVFQGISEWVSKGLKDFTTKTLSSLRKVLSFRVPKLELGNEGKVTYIYYFVF